ncbi:MAG: type II toxin-antitoxin system RelE/ParE family toxin [Bacteroidetes bacterium]|nr:type II toxin-antitoxin system RelE/ParE family toxin [Bacteroidota bacterium]
MLKIFFVVFSYMDKIAKFLARLNSQEKALVKIIFKKIQENNFKGLDLKKLKGYQDIFRIRKGKIRIIYRLDENRQIFILAIERRSEKTYNF